MQASLLDLRSQANYPTVGGKEGRGVSRLANTLFFLQSTCVYLRVCGYLYTCVYVDLHALPVYTYVCPFVYCKRHIFICIYIFNMRRIFQFGLFMLLSASAATGDANVISCVSAVSALSAAAHIFVVEEGIMAAGFWYLQVQVCVWVRKWFSRTWVFETRDFQQYRLNWTREHVICYDFISPGSV